jgi:hypothetical protein
MGPVSRRLVVRLIAVLAVLVVVGHCWSCSRTRLECAAAGLSLVFPGALYIASPLLFVVAMCALVCRGAVVGVQRPLGDPLVWLTAGIAAVLLANGPRLFVDRGTVWSWTIPVVYLLAAGAVGVAVVRTSRVPAQTRKVPESQRVPAAAECR